MRSQHGVEVVDVGDAMTAVEDIDAEDVVLVGVEVHVVSSSSAALLSPSGRCVGELGGPAPKQQVGNSSLRFFLFFFPLFPGIFSAVSSAQPSSSLCLGTGLGGSTPPPGPVGTSVAWLGSSELQVVTGDRSAA